MSYPSSVVSSPALGASDRPKPQPPQRSATQPLPKASGPSRPRNNRKGKDLARTNDDALAAARTAVATAKTAVAAAKTAAKTAAAANGDDDGVKLKQHFTLPDADPVVRSLSDPGAQRAQRFAKPPPQDDYGFVSKGDTRLLDYDAQEDFHKRIVRAYLEFCGAAGSSDVLATEFQNLAAAPPSRPWPPPPLPRTSSSLQLSLTSTSAPRTTSANEVYANARNAELSAVLLRMRKLREGLVASGRKDAFAVSVYQFQVRAAILVQQVDMYVPALQYLLDELLPAVSADGVSAETASSSVVSDDSTADAAADATAEFAAYLLLHHACYSVPGGGVGGGGGGGGGVGGNLMVAHEVRHTYGVNDSRALQLLDAVTHGNYWSFRAARNRVDQYMGRLADHAEPRMRALALQAVAKTYFTVDVAWLETVVGMSWQDMRDTFKVGWELDPATGVVTVRRPKKKESAPPPTPGEVALAEAWKAWD